MPPTPHPPPFTRSSQRFKFKHNMYKLREERDIKPSAFGQMVSATLYERRFGPYFCQPVIGALALQSLAVACSAGSAAQASWEPCKLWAGYTGRP